HHRFSYNKSKKNGGVIFFRRD
ncbi:hypothetical protein, partial [Neobacillus drentensis]